MNVHSSLGQQEADEFKAHLDRFNGLIAGRFNCQALLKMRSQLAQENALVFARVQRSLANSFIRVGRALILPIRDQQRDWRAVIILVNAATLPPSERERLIALAEISVLPACSQLFRLDELKLLERHLPQLSAPANLLHFRKPSQSLGSQLKAWLAEPLAKIPRPGPVLILADQREQLLRAALLLHERVGTSSFVPLHELADSVLEELGQWQGLRESTLFIEDSSCLSPRQLHQLALFSDILARAESPQLVVGYLRSDPPPPTLVTQLCRARLNLKPVLWPRGSDLTH